MGISYARGVENIQGGNLLYVNLINARQSLVTSLSSTDVSPSLTVVNTHLANETAFFNVSSNASRTSLSALNSFYASSNGYSKSLRDMFPSLSPTNTVYWKNSFKEAFNAATSTELIQLVGFVTFAGSTGYFVPFVSTANASGAWNPNPSNITVSTSATQMTITDSSFDGYLSNYALPSFNVLNFTGTFPSPASISLSTQSIVGFANSNTFSLSTSATGDKAFFYRPLKTAELLELRWADSSISGVAATGLLGSVTFTVGLANTSFSISTSSGTRLPLYLPATSTSPNAAFKSKTVNSITVNTPENLGTQKVLEVWVRSTT